MPERPQRVGIYCRLSYTEDGDEEKVDRQEGDCRDLAGKLRWSVSDLHVFKDNNRSAWQRHRKRPGWDCMLAAVENDEIDGVVVYHGDRLIRQPWDLELLLQLADDRHLALASPSGVRDLNNEDDRFSLARRRFHHLTFYGFLLCFAATSVATLYHFLLRWEAPYPVTSLPVVLGSLGGLGLIAGPLGLLWLNLKRDPRQGDVAQRPMDRGFIALLLLVSVTGFGVLLLRDGAGMGLALAIHLGAVMALFLTLPYGKFAHGIFRSAALFKHAIERRLPSRLQLGSD